MTSEYERALYKDPDEAACAIAGLLEDVRHLMERVEELERNERRRRS